MRGNEQRPAQSWLQLVCFDHPGLLGINHYPRKVSFGRLGTWSALLYRKSKRPWSMPVMMGGVIPIFWRQRGPGLCLYRHSQRSSKKSSSWQNQCRFPHTAFSALTSFSFLWLLRLCTELLDQDQPKMSEIPPRTQDEWKSQMKTRELTGQTMHDKTFHSASKFTQEEFLSMRILRQPVDPEDFNFKLFGLDWDLIEDAKRKLGGYKSWDWYRNSFQKGKDTGEGNFFLVKSFQDETKAAESPEISSSISPKKNLFDDTSAQSWKIQSSVSVTNQAKQHIDWRCCHSWNQQSIWRKSNTCHSFPPKLKSVTRV